MLQAVRVLFRGHSTINAVGVGIYSALNVEMMGALSVSFLLPLLALPSSAFNLMALVICL